MTQRAYPLVRMTPSAVHAAHGPIWQPYTLSKLPPRPLVDNRSLYQPHVFNQGVLGDCSAFGSLQCRMAAFVAAGGQYGRLSELADYYQERVLNGTVGADSGATMAEAITVLERDGAEPEAADAYADNYGQRYLDAPPAEWQAQYQLKPEQVLYIGNDLAKLKDALNRGLPVVIGIAVFAELESAACAQSGILTMPANPQAPVGGHMINAVIDDAAHQRIGILNQWDWPWGVKAPARLHGCFWMPYAYFQQYAFDAVALLPDNGVAPKPTPDPTNDYLLETQWVNPVTDAAQGAVLWIMTSQGMLPVSGNVSVQLTWKNGTQQTMQTTQTVTTNAAGWWTVEPNVDACTSVDALCMWTDPSGQSHEATATVQIDPLPKPLPPPVAGQGNQSLGLGLQITLTPQTSQWTCGDHVTVTGLMTNGGQPLADYPVQIRVSNGEVHQLTTDAQGQVSLLWTTHLPGYVQFTLAFGYATATTATVWSAATPTPAPVVTPPTPTPVNLATLTVAELAHSPNGTFGSDNLRYQEAARKVLGDQQKFGTLAGLVHRPLDYWAGTKAAADLLWQAGVRS